MRRRPIARTRISAGVLVVVVTVLTACSSGSTPTSTPATTPDAYQAPTTTAAPTSVRPWFLKDGAVTPAAARPLGPDQVRGALDALMAGPSPDEQAAGFSTAIAADVVVDSFAIGADGVVTVGFNRRFETADTRPQVAEVVYTLTELPQVTGVRFLIDGQPNGATGVPPVGRAGLRFPAAAG